MEIYTSATELEKHGICHRNSVSSYIKQGRIVKVTTKKGKMVGYFVTSELFQCQ